MTRATETQHHGDEFVERNAWLHLLLGLEAWGQRFDALVDAHAPDAEGPRPFGPVSAADARLIDFVLGIAAMRASLRRALAAATNGARGPARSRPTGAGDGAEWLR